MASAISFGNANSGFEAGIINGPVTTTFHAERPETPPSPSLLIPFRRDPDFVGRAPILEEIQQRCVPGCWSALVGLGGVGKSQLAIEHAYRTREQSPSMWVFWIHASNVARFEQSYRDLANRVKIPARRDPKANILELVHDWLCDSNRQWMLILDNVDDASFLFDATATSSYQTSKLLRDYLPQSQNGCIIITTRSREAALKLVEVYDIIKVDPMDEAHALALFEKKLGLQENNNDIAELSVELEFMPLAIVQAAAYIVERAPWCSVRQYLDQFRKSDRERMRLLDREGGQLRRDGEARNSIIITWQISFDHIRQTKPSATDLLSLMSFFDRQGIPEDVLWNQIQHRSCQNDNKMFEDHDDDDDDDAYDDASSHSSTSDDFKDDVLVLRNFSFISISPGGATFEMHRLVQLATRKWLEAHGQLESWRHQFIRSLFVLFPTGRHENWTTCQKLFPHAQSAATQQPKEESSLAEWAALLYNTSWYAWTKGSANEAETLAMKSMKARTELFGQNHQHTLESMGMLALAYNHQGRWTEAEKLGAQVMESRKRVLGDEHPDTLTSMSNLALTYRRQGRLTDAEKLGAQVMESSKRVLGDEHPDTLTSMNNLAMTYNIQGRWKDAEKLGTQVMESCKRVLEDEHPDTLTSMSNLAMTYNMQGRWKDAEKLGVQVMESSKRVLGGEHPDTLTSISNLASTYNMQGRWKDAEKLDAQVMESRKRLLGDEHPDTLTSMSNLASTYSRQGRWKDAEKLGTQVMESRKRVLGDEHPDTLTSMSNLASKYGRHGRWKDAEKLGMQVMESRKRVLGDEHPDTLTSMSNLAMTYNIQGRWKDAEKLDAQVMESRKRVLEDEHPGTLTSMSNLACTWKYMGRDAEAIRLMEECVQLRKKIIGVDHPNTLFSSSTLTTWLSELKI